MFRFGAGLCPALGKLYIYYENDDLRYYIRKPYKYFPGFNGRRAFAVPVLHRRLSNEAICTCLVVGHLVEFMYILC